MLSGKQWTHEKAAQKARSQKKKKQTNRPKTNLRPHPKKLKDVYCLTFSNDFGRINNQKLAGK